MPSPEKNQKNVLFVCIFSAGVSTINPPIFIPPCTIFIVPHWSFFLFSSPSAVPMLLSQCLVCFICQQLTVQPLTTNVAKSILFFTPPSGNLVMKWPISHYETSGLAIRRQGIACSDTVSMENIAPDTLVRLG